MSGLGDRCKEFEGRETSRAAMKGLPLIARLDGRAFHTFTRGLKRPYDPGFIRCMVETTKALVDDMHPLCGYTQSDEITLIWHVAADSVSEYPFDGRYQKLASVLAGLASSAFCANARHDLPNKINTLPHFDGRVWQVPTLQDALDVLVWREDDATKNSITMAAQAHYSHTELLGKNSSDKQEMLFQKSVNWNDYPSEFKRGTYVKRMTEFVRLTEDEVARIPASYRPEAGQLVQRSHVRELVGFQPIRRNPAAMEVLFGVKPVEVRLPSSGEG